jgi:hypothetical protein
MLAIGLSIFWPLGLLATPVAALVLLWIWFRYRRLPADSPELRSAEGFIVFFTAEELAFAPGGWVFFFGGSLGAPDGLVWDPRPGFLPVYLAGLCLLAAALRRGRIPEWLFPLRGRWLRLFLSAGAVLLLLYVGPWLDYMLIFARILPLWALAVFVVWVDLCLYCFTLVRVLAE